MKFRSVVIVAAMIVFTSGTTNAAIFGDSWSGGGETVTLIKSTMPIGESGTIFTSPNANSGSFQSNLANNSKITFSYTFSSTSPSNALGAATGWFNPTYYSQADSSGFSFYLTTASIFVTANISGLNGFTSISNTSGQGIDFASSFYGLLQQVSNGRGGTVGHINYNVSAVPLPASVVMFGSAIAALFGCSYLSRQRKGTILQA